MKNPGSSPTGLAAAMALALIPCSAQTARADADSARARHVIVISVDGLHESDLEAYIASHATSTLAKFVNEGVSYSNAHTPFPSDSFPGLTAIMTGAHPRSAGVYYDDSWNRSLLPAGTTSCAGVAPGVEVTYFEQLDIDLNSIDAGSGVGDLSTFAAIRQNIYKMSQQARDAIDPKQLPVDPATCQPVYPHTYLRVNTIFEVAKAHGLHTAWSDKHVAYDLVNGPSGTGVDDLFAPEINSVVPTDTLDGLPTPYGAGAAPLRYRRWHTSRPDGPRRWSARGRSRAALSERARAPARVWVWAWVSAAAASWRSGPRTVADWRSGCDLPMWHQPGMRPSGCRRRPRRWHGRLIHPMPPRGRRPRRPLRRGSRPQPLSRTPGSGLHRRRSS